MEEGESFEQQESLATQESAMATAEEMALMGLSTNGLSTNGLSTNGLSTNGLSTNGLSTNGLMTGTFKDWFEMDRTLRATVMKYIVMCAVPQGQSRTYTSLVTGQTYTWYGLLGLTPGWASGLQPTVAEQQIITACLAAHTNKFGLNVNVSVLGRGATNAEIPYTSSELALFSETEACFFGNTFTSEGIFAAIDRPFLKTSESTSRACGLTWSGQSADCAPMAHVGSCQEYCTLDATKTYYVSCTYNGVTYKPLTTRVRPVDIYRCGDGTCQFTEKCGNGSQYDSCAADCGACAP
ncbi:Gamma-glutamyltranspeptidase [Hyalangium minutum]|uniref:Gamma-glutamyltranspeptidase n=1 Tax=Hyalangium minutum TaxID=394096 RepID=A0A085WUD2_9BACT|nr:Gamma-glutamyltranspeptidase [Hyalangium minutum]